MFFFPVSVAIASSSYPGATRHSMKSWLMRSAACASTGRLTATTDPKALRGSVARARRYARASDSPTPRPHGVVCLMMATAGRGERAKGARLSSAPSRSRMLL